MQQEQEGPCPCFASPVSPARTRTVTIVFFFFFFFLEIKVHCLFDISCINHPFSSPSSSHKHGHPYPRLDKRTAPLGCCQQEGHCHLPPLERHPRLLGRVQVDRKAPHRCQERYVVLSVFTLLPPYPFLAVQLAPFIREIGCLSRRQLRTTRKKIAQHYGVFRMR